MSAPYYGIEWKVENALRALVLAANRDGVPVYLGSDNKSLMHEDEDDSQALQAPYILCICDDAPQYMDGQDIGVYTCSARVEVWTHKHDEPGAAHADRNGWIRDVLITDTLKNELCAAANDFHCLKVLSSGFRQDVIGSFAVGTITLSLICSPSDL